MQEGKSMGRLASELLAQQLGTGPAPELDVLEWTSRDLGVPRIDLEDKEALASTLDTQS